ncbi:MAG TPA: PepSY-like domain-containing protein [Bacteroidia bacterium]|nr:PepSY-like domain-containing protein [Bacteroidia bacterium]
MKFRFFILLAFVISSCTATAQELKSADVPAPVRTAFEKLYPSVKDVDWEKEDANYEAEFEISKTEQSVVFDALGNLLETEVEIAVSELPKAASEYVAKNHAGTKISEAAKITDAQGTVTYEAEVGKSDLIFDAQGNFIKEIKEDGKDETED